MAPKIENVKLQIVRATESSGNVQFFVRAVRTDDTKTLFGNLLDYHCHQTKHNLTEDECVDRAMFSLTYLVRFFGHKGKDVEFVGFTEDNMKSVKSAKRFWRISDGEEVSGS